MLIIGDGPERKRLLNLCNKLELNKFTKFYGSCYDEKKIALLISASDLCVSPGEIGLTCMHSLVYGTPVISHNDKSRQGPEVEAIIPGKTGDLFEYCNIKDLSIVMEKWLFKKRNEKEISEKCIEIIRKRYNPYKQVQTINFVVKKIFEK
jgi:glycosyltransferase involved in cell wall biosynthesis